MYASSFTREPGTVPVDQRPERDLVPVPHPGQERVVVVGVEHHPHGFDFVFEPLSPF